MRKTLSTVRKNLDEYNWDKFYKEFQQESPRAAVILSGAFLDSLFRDLLASFMIENDKTCRLGLRLASFVISNPY